MAIGIRQFCHEDAARVARLWRSVQAGDAAAGGEPDMSRIDALTSLVAHDGDRLVGIAISQVTAASGRDRELSVATAGGDAELARMLVARAMAKLRSRGIHKCRVILSSDGDDASMWQPMRWPGDCEPRPAPV